MQGFTFSEKYSIPISKQNKYARNLMYQYWRNIVWNISSSVLEATGYDESKRAQISSVLLLYSNCLLSMTKRDACPLVLELFCGYIGG